MTATLCDVPHASVPIELTVSQVAELCGVKPSTVRTWLDRGRLTRNYRGLITGSDVLEWMDHGRDSRKVTKKLRTVM